MRTVDHPWLGGVAALTLASLLAACAEERTTIAVVVIGGQSLSLVLTLIVTPVMYGVFDDLFATTRVRLVAADAQRLLARARAALARE